MSINTRELYIEKMSFPPNMCDIKIGDEFQIIFDIFRNKEYIIRNNTKKILLVAKIIWLGYAGIIKNSTSKDITEGKTTICLRFKKYSEKFDITCELYEVKLFGLYKQLEHATSYEYRK